MKLNKIFQMSLKYVTDDFFYALFALFVLWKNNKTKYLQGPTVWLWF